MKSAMLGRTLGCKTPKHRWAMMRNLVTSLVKYERIETTLPKAKALQKLSDRVITYAKKNTIESKGKLQAIIREQEPIYKLQHVFAKRYAQRHGGYTRILRTRERRGDGAKMAYIEFIDRPGELRVPRPPKAPTKTPWLKHNEELVKTPPKFPYLRESQFSEEKAIQLNNDKHLMHRRKQRKDPRIFLLTREKLIRFNAHKRRVAIAQSERRRAKLQKSKFKI